VREALEEAADICRKRAATLILVDFRAVQGWRDHQFINDWAIRSSITVEKIAPDEIWIDGYKFDPHVHFQQWRRTQFRWSESKTDRKAQALKRAWELQEAGFSYSRAAASLNAEGIRSPTGKEWTKDSLRKFVQASDIIGAP